MVVFPSIAMVETTVFPGPNQLCCLLSMSWVATSSSIQLMNGRPSDIVGHNALLLVSISLLALSDLHQVF
jgi:hypothetical protein